jgi:uncharacterized protein YndB with AHSA1/START domain
VSVLTASRVVAAPVERLWRAFTTAEGVAAFWGGHHATVPTDSVELDVRPGGRFELVTVAPDGRRHPLAFVFDEVDEPHRLVFTEPEVGIVTTVDLTRDEGGTLVTIHQRQVPPELRGPDAERGLAGILDALAAHTEER